MKTQRIDMLIHDNGVTVVSISLFCYYKKGITHIN